MNMELTVNDNSGRSMAEMMGVDTLRTTKDI